MKTCSTVLFSLSEVRLFFCEQLFCSLCQYVQDNPEHDLSWITNQGDCSIALVTAEVSFLLQQNYQRLAPLFGPFLSLLYFSGTGWSGPLSFPYRNASIVQTVLCRSREICLISAYEPLPPLILSKRKVILAFALPFLYQADWYMALVGSYTAPLSIWFISWRQLHFLSEVLLCRSQWLWYGSAGS